MTADLIVVDTLARLYDCPEDKMLCHVLVVIGRGASVVTLPAWNLAARNPNKVAPTSVIRHQLLAIHAFPDALCRPSTQQRRPERQHRNTNSSVSMMWGVCGNGSLQVGIGMKKSRYPLSYSLISSLYCISDRNDAVNTKDRNYVHQISFGVYYIVSI